MRFQTIVTRSLASTALVLAIAPDALALEANEFGSRLKAVLENQNVQLNYAEATLEGSNVTLSEVTATLADMPTPFPLGSLTFENVTEDEDGFLAERLGASGLEGELPPMGEGADAKPASYSIGEWALEGIRLPSENASGTLGILSSAGFIYDRMFIRDAAITVDGQPFATLTNAESTMDIGAATPSFSAKVEDAMIDLTIPPDPEGEMTKWVEGTGYETLTLDVDMDGTWDPAAGVIDIPTYDIVLEDMGQLSIDLNFGGYTPAFIEQMQSMQKQMSSDDPQAQQAASMQMLGLVSQLSFGGFSMGYSDEGMADKLLEYYAQENGQTKDQLVQQTLSVLPLALGQLQAPEMQAEITSAVSTFLNDPKSITVTLEPDTPVAFPALMGAAMSSPAELMRALNAKIMANQAQ